MIDMPNLLVPVASQRAPVGSLWHVGVRIFISASTMSYHNVGQLPSDGHLSYPFVAAVEVLLCQVKSPLVLHANTHSYLFSKFAL